MGVVVVGDTATICGGIWLGVVVFCGGYLWRRNMRAAFWIGNGGVGFGRVVAVEKFKFS
ncbi:hypothetical protein [Campylobacter hyointestinalis]|uniref:hypothetical protein n=1 Tax=Campylobacter hyointestinalis TaxID=198 RepID=UPI0015EB8B10|nr:hypothetical protein [Campylobacter hyointestinalis]